MASSGTLHHVAVVRTDVSEERIAPHHQDEMRELETLAVTSNTEDGGDTLL
jgi:hypothetical protein